MVVCSAGFPSKKPLEDAAAFGFIQWQGGGVLVAGGLHQGSSGIWRKISFESSAFASVGLITIVRDADQSHVDQLCRLTE